MARTDPTIYMRIPEDLKEALDKAAAENKRSLTAEVVARLEQTFAAAGNVVPRGDASNSVIDRLAALEKQLATRSREETLLRLKHMQHSMATQAVIHSEAIERWHARLLRAEADADEAEDRGDLGAAKRLRAKVREDRKILSEMEAELRTIQSERMQAEADIQALLGGNAAPRRRVKLNEDAE